MNVGTVKFSCATYTIPNFISGVGKMRYAFYDADESIMLIRRLCY